MIDSTVSCKDEYATTSNEGRKFVRRVDGNPDCYQADELNASISSQEHTIIPLAFTLGDLLVVIVISAIFIYLLLPPLYSVRGAAQSALCLSNERQMVFALNQYFNDGNGD